MRHADPFPDSVPLSALGLAAPAGSLEFPALPNGWKFAGLTDMVVFVGTPGHPRESPCRVYWGSHGCDLERGHPGGADAHDCGCCECVSHPDPDSGCVGKFPFYGPDTKFYGEDAQ